MPSQASGDRRSPRNSAYHRHQQRRSAAHQRIGLAHIRYLGVVFATSTVYTTCNAHDASR